MARAKVEIEIPENCAECPLEYDYLCMAMGDVLDDECSIYTERDKRCPLVKIKESWEEQTDVSG